MFRGEELARLTLEKQALVAESGLNRLVLQAEIRHLRSAAAWVSEAAQWPRKGGPLLLVLAPLAGFLLTRVSRLEDGWLKRVLAAAKWVGPLYQLWKGFACGQEATSDKPAP